MKIVTITKNARLKKDDDGGFYLLIESSAGSLMIGLSTVETNPITHETKSIGFDDVLDVFMKEQEAPIVNSPN